MLHGRVFVMVLEEFASYLEVVSKMFQEFVMRVIPYKHHANTPIQYTAIFHGCKNVNFQIKKIKYFFLFLLKTLIMVTH